MTILGKTLLIIGAALVGLTLALYATISAFWLDSSARMYLGGALLLVGLVFGGVTVLLLNRFVSSRLTHLSASVRRIGTLGDLSARVELSGRDELSQLAHTINHMLAALERARREQQGAEAELHLQHDFAMQLMNAMPLGVTVTDGEGRFEYVNPAYAHLLGYAPDTLIGRTPWEFTHPEDHAALNTARRPRSQGKTTTCETRLVRADGSTVYSLITGTPLWREGKPEGAIVAVTNLTEHKEAEAALRESEARYRQLVETASDIIYRTDAQGRFTYVNPVAIHLSGRTAPDELLGQHYLDWVRPDYRREVARFYLQQYHDQIPTTYLELPVVAREGRELWIGQNVQLLTEGGKVVGFLVVAHDITERKRVEFQLREAEAKYRTLVEQIPAVVYIDSLGSDSPLLYISPRVESLLGYAAAELQTDRELWPRLLHPTDRERALSTDEHHLTTGEPLHHEYRLLARDGRVIWVRDEAIIVHDEAGHPLFSQGVLLDITDRKRAEAEIRQLNQELEQRVIERTAELESANRALEEERALLAQRVAERTADLSAVNAELARAARLKDEFLASMSHELRTPLNTILGMSEALQEEIYGPLTPEQADSLHSIEESGRHLLELINDILDLSKIEAGRLELQIATTSVETVCQASLRLIKQPAQKKRLQVAYTPDPTMNELQADERRLKQILVNLLSNAVKFTPEEGRIGLEVRGDPEGQMVRFTVWDTGIGIARDEQVRLFQPFVQLDSRLSRQHNGTGLGLSLVRRMTELHGGSVSLESEPGQGSRFTVSFPWHDDTELDPFEKAGEVEQGEPESIPQGYRVLLVEDSSAAAGQLTRYLSEWGFRSTVHPYGEGAVEKAQETQPQVILLDILLPDLAGWEVLKRLKADPRTQRIPVVIVSVVDERPLGMAQGATDYLVKPVSREQLRSALSRVFQRAPKTRKLAPSVSPSSGGPPLLLIADDNESNIHTLSGYLRARGYDVGVARNGYEAIERALEDRPDAILMDIQMPVLDGLEATRRIRAHAETASIPIIALTALAMAGDRERCLAAGADDYLSKPVSLRALVKAIDAQLRRKPDEETH